MKTILCLVISVLSSAALWAQTADDDTAGNDIKDYSEQETIPASDWKKANGAYVDADYRQAIELYETILASGKESYVLYYNLGNAYFKNGETAKAIVNYNRALRLEPFNEDVKFNLAVANTFVRDKIDSVPVFFVKRWVDSIRSSNSSNTWAVISLVCFAVLCASAAVYLLIANGVIRKAGFYAGFACLVLSITSISFASTQKRKITAPDEAVITGNSVSVKNSPDNGSKDIFVLHSGTKIKIVGELNGWREIMIADGNKGWLQASSIEVI